MRSALRAFYIFIICASLLAMVLSLRMGEFHIRYVATFFIFLSLLYSDKAKERKAEERTKERESETNTPQSSVKECAKCGLVNSVDATKCDCGYRL